MFRGVTVENTEALAFLVVRWGWRWGEVGVSSRQSPAVGLRAGVMEPDPPGREVTAPRDQSGVLTTDLRAAKRPRLLSPPTRRRVGEAQAPGSWKELPVLGGASRPVEAEGFWGAGTLLPPNQLPRTRDPHK